MACAASPLDITLLGDDVAANNLTTNVMAFSIVLVSISLLNTLTARRVLLPSLVLEEVIAFWFCKRWIEGRSVR